MQFTYKKFDIFGKIFFRILQRPNATTSWSVAIGSIDCDSEDDAKRIVKELESRDRKNRNRRERDQILRDSGLKRVRGALGGVYWE